MTYTYVVRSMRKISYDVYICHEVTPRNFARSRNKDSIKNFRCWKD